MKRIFTMLIVVALIFSLVGCGNNNASAPKGPEETSGNQTVVEETQQNPTAPETENHQDDSGVAKKYDNPGDDPRMITQVNWKSGYFAFIDQYNLIGYSLKSDGGVSGAHYYYYENEGYFPKADSWKKYYSEPMGDEFKGNLHLGYIDLDGWIGSYGMSGAEISVDGSSFSIAYGKAFVNFDSYSSILGYNIRTGEKSRPSWMLHETSYVSGVDAPCLYGTLQGTEISLSPDTEILWAFEQAFKALAENSTENPW